MAKQDNIYICKFQISALENLSAKRAGPCIIKELIGKNALRLDPPDRFKIHPIEHVMHITHFVEQSKDISEPGQERSEPISTVDGDFYNVEKILIDRKRGKGYQFLTPWEVFPDHDAIWQTRKDFIIREGNDIWTDTITENGILPQHRSFSVDDDVNRWRWAKV